MPAGDDPDWEVKGDECVNGEHKRRRQTREQQVRGFIAMPVAGGSAPSEGEHSVNHFERRLVAAITQGREVWDQTHEPEQSGYGGVGGDRKYVPHERAAEL